MLNKIDYELKYINDEEFKRTHLVDYNCESVGDLWKIVIFDDFYVVFNDILFSNMMV